MWRIAVVCLLTTLIADAQVLIDRKGPGRVVITNTAPGPEGAAETPPPVDGVERAGLERFLTERVLRETGFRPARIEVRDPISEEPLRPVVNKELTMQRVVRTHVFGLYENASGMFAVVSPPGSEDRGLVRLPGGEVGTVGEALRCGLGWQMDPSSSFEVVQFVRPEGENRLPQNLHLYLGKDATRWKSDVPVFASLRYRDLVPGVDAFVTSNELWTETEFVFGPGVDLSAFRLDYPLHVTTVLEDGSIVTNLPGSLETYVVQPAIEFFQLRSATRVPIRGAIRRTRSGEYPAIPVTGVDPGAALHVKVRVMKYTRGTVGSPVAEEELDIRKQNPQLWPTGAAVTDAEGFTYVVESPSCDSCFRWIGGDADTSQITAITRYRPSGAVAWTALLSAGPESSGIARGRPFVALDHAGNALVTSAAHSAEAFPGLDVRATPRGGTSFLSRLSSDGRLQFSVLLPIERASRVEAAGVAETDSGLLCAAATVKPRPVFEGDIATVPAVVKGGSTARGNHDGYLACFDPSSAEPLRFSTFVGGSETDLLAGLAAASGGVLYVGGTTWSRDLPRPTGALVGICDPFVARIETRGGVPIISTRYLGGSDDSEGMRWSDGLGDLAVGPDGTVWLAGYTLGGSSFPVAGEALAGGGGFRDIFVTGFSPQLDVVRRSFRFGSSRDDEVKALSIDPDGNLHLLGIAGAHDFPGLTHVASAIGSRDGYWFLTKINSAQTALLWSTSLGSASLSNDHDFSFAAGPKGQLRIPVRFGMGRWSVGGSRISFLLQTSLVDVKPRASQEAPAIKAATQDGSKITIRGEGFAQGAEVRVDGAIVEASLVDAGKTLMAEAPRKTTAVRIDVINPDRQSATTVMAALSPAIAQSVIAKNDALTRSAILAGIAAFALLVAVLWVAKRRLRAR